MYPSHKKKKKKKIRTIYRLIKFPSHAFFPPGMSNWLLHSLSPEDDLNNLGFSNFFPVLKWFVHKC